MSHLGDRLTAFVDGELSHGERERALGHLTCCEQCRIEADALRQLKRRLGSLGDATPPAALIGQLHAMAEPGGPLPPRPRPLPGSARPPVIPRPRSGRPRDNRPARTAAGPGGQGLVAAAHHRRLPRRRYLLVSAATLAVFGVGTASFVAGRDARPLPRVAPAVERFAVQHALTSGDVPLPDPTPVQPVGNNNDTTRP